MDFRESLQAGKIGIGGAGDHWSRLFGQKVLGGYGQGYAEGAIASFSDGVNAPVDKLLVAITPVQSGTGDPSPENVRPITGWTGCTVSRSGADTSDPTTFAITWQSEAGTVYGGELDVTSGVLTVTHILETYNGTENWLNGQNNSVYIPNSIFTDLDSVLYANFLKGLAKGSSYGMPAWSIRLNTSITNLLVKLDTSVIADAAAWKTYLATNNLQVMYELATPIEYDLTPTEVTTLLGVNNIWADTGDVKVWYKKKK